jgi:hypothetical protein
MTLLPWALRKALWDRVYGMLFRAIRIPALPMPNDDAAPTTPWQVAHGPG